MDIGAKIKSYIDKQGISQIELCQKTHIQPAKMNLSLNGKRRLTFPEYQTICWALGVGVEEFLTPMPPQVSAS